MPKSKLKKIKHAIGFFLSVGRLKKPAEQVPHKEYGFIVKRDGVYDYMIMNLPEGYDINKGELDEWACIVECRKMTDKFTEKKLKKQVALFNERYQEKLAKLERKARKHH